MKHHMKHAPESKFLKMIWRYEVAIVSYPQLSAHATEAEIILFPVL